MAETESAEKQAAQNEIQWLKDHEEEIRELSDLIPKFELEAKTLLKSLNEELKVKEYRAIEGQIETLKSKAYNAYERIYKIKKGKAHHDYIESLDPYTHY